MTSPLRRLAGLATTGALLGLLALSPTMPVSALERADGAIRVTENQTVEKEYGPLAMPNPTPGLPDPAPSLTTPENCRQAAYCDTIPLEIVTPPTLKESDEFFVTVTLAWESDRFDGVSAGGHDYVKPQDINDLDLYVYEDPVPETGEPAQQAATTVRPEVARIYRPTNGKYSIVVFNYVGPNTGYKLKVEYKPENIVPPFELLPPEWTPVATPSVPYEPPAEVTEPDFSRLPIDTSGVEDTPPAPTAPPAEAAPPPLTPVEIDPDPDFTDFADDAFDEQLAAPRTDVLTEKQVRAVGPPEPPSTTSLVFWLAAVPMLLLAGGGIWLSKKGSAVLKLR